MNTIVIDYFNGLQEEMESWRHDLHRHPELAYKEFRTADFLAEHLTSFGFQPVLGIGGTGIVATLDRGEGPSSALRTDMDALPIHEELSAAASLQMQLQNIVSRSLDPLDAGVVSAGLKRQYR